MHEQKFREELSPDEVDRRIESFFAEVGRYFEDTGAVIQPIQGGIVSITTDASQKECDERVKRCLNSLDLYAEKIK
ncbi:hypothetical protein [Pseudoxanthomonas mexicana]|uniref:hypothetical protein n=1 Tax=Pseudoxanthomonas mexicana TaxID=128785 RepID=UPI00398AC958